MQVVRVCVACATEGVKNMKFLQAVSGVLWVGGVAVITLAATFQARAADVYWSVGVQSGPAVVVPSRSAYPPPRVVYAPPPPPPRQWWWCPPVMRCHHRVGTARRIAVTARPTTTIIVTTIGAMRAKIATIAAQGPPAITKMWGISIATVGRVGDAEFIFLQQPCAKLRA